MFTSDPTSGMLPLDFYLHTTSTTPHAGDAVMRAYDGTAWNDVTSPTSAQFSAAITDILDRATFLEGGSVKVVASILFVSQLFASLITVQILKSSNLLGGGGSDVTQGMEIDMNAAKLRTLMFRVLADGTFSVGPVASPSMEVTPAGVTKIHNFIDSTSHVGMDSVGIFVQNSDPANTPTIGDRKLYIGGGGGARGYQPTGYIYAKTGASSFAWLPAGNGGAITKNIIYSYGSGNYWDNVTATQTLATLRDKLRLLFTSFRKDQTSAHWPELGQPTPHLEVTGYITLTGTFAGSYRIEGILGNYACAGTGDLSLASLPTYGCIALLLSTGNNALSTLYLPIDSAGANYGLGVFRGAVSLGTSLTLASQTITKGLVINPYFGEQYF